MEKVSIVESKEKGGSTSKRDPTKWDLQKHTDAELIRRLGYLHGGLPSQDVKSEDSTAENSNSSKCEKDQVQSEYVRDIHYSAGNSMDSSDECILDQENLRQAQVLDPGMSVLYKGMEQNKRPTWDKFPIQMMRLKLIGLSGRELCYTMGYCVGNILTLKRTPISYKLFYRKVTEIKFKPNYMTM